MNIIAALETERLTLEPLAQRDGEFILELVNSAGWLQFIGDRNVHNAEDAANYIKAILENQQIAYWTVRSKTANRPIGIVTFIKKDYLEFPDIGFAFLPAQGKLGYAYEASDAVLRHVLSTTDTANVYATTVPENIQSIGLLSKLGFEYKNGISVDSDQLQVYQLTAPRVDINRLVWQFLAEFNNQNGRTVQLESLRSLCHPKVQLIKKFTNDCETLDLDSFIETRQGLLTDGSLIDFQESETTAQTSIKGGLAQRISTITKSWQQNGTAYRQTGTKLFQLLKNDTGWQISAVLWEDEAPEVQHS